MQILRYQLPNFIILPLRFYPPLFSSWEANPLDPFQKVGFNARKKKINKYVCACIIFSQITVHMQQEKLHSQVPEHKMDKKKTSDKNNLGSRQVTNLWRSPSIYDTW